MKRIYLDCAAGTPVDKEVIKATEPYFGEKYGNAGSLHSFGQEVMAAIDKSREIIAKAINADFGEIIFTGSATEANNLALRGAIKAIRQISRETGRLFAPAAKSGLDSRQIDSFGDQAQSASETFRSKIAESLRIIVSSIEHESVLETARDLEKDGVEVVYLPVNKEGFIDLKKLKSSLNERTILVSVMYANNRIGTIQPISEIAKIIKEFRRPTTHNPQPTTYPLFHTDAVQAFQYLDCDVKKLGVDLLTLSAQKIYGPKGVGALYVRDLPPTAYNLQPVTTGGGQEFGLRSGTENVPAIAGFGKAAELVLKNQKKESKRIKGLSDYFWRGIKKNFPKAELNGGAPKLPNILSVYFPGFSGRDLLIKLDLAGVAVSSGAACSVRAAKPCYVLWAIGFMEERVLNSLRFSFGRITQKTDLKKTLKILKKILNES